MKLRLPFALGLAMASVTLAVKNWFVFGEATFKERVGVFSLARHDPAFFYGGSSLEALPAVKALMLRRACVTLSHESGHMFGWAHCRYYRCLMGGSGSLEESDCAPAALCPVCLRKLYSAKAFDPAQRQEQLWSFFQRHGMMEDAAEAEGILHRKPWKK